MKQQRLGMLFGGLVAAALLASCVPLFTDGLFQTLQISFRLDRDLAAGEESLVHTAVFPERVKVKKTFVQISGRLTAADGEAAPSQVTIEAEIEDAGGKLVQRVTLKLAVDESGSFTDNARLRKDISAGDVLSVTVEPSAVDLAAGSEVVLCVDLVKKRGDLGLVPDCVPADEPDGGDPDATFSSLVNDHLAPGCAVAGCHSAASASSGLVLEPGQAYANLVGIPSAERPDLNRVTPNDPDNSYLVKKLRGDNDIEGARMPLGGPFLAAAEIDRFVRWIDNGAPDN